MQGKYVSSHGKSDDKTCPSLKRKGSAQLEDESHSEPGFGPNLANKGLKGTSEPTG